MEPPLLLPEEEDEDDDRLLEEEGVYVRLGVELFEFRPGLLYSFPPELELENTFLTD